MGVQLSGIALLATLLLSTNSVSAQTPTAEYLRRTYGHILPAPACETDEFIVRFDAGTSEIGDSARTQFHADLRHPRTCNVEAVYLAAYDLAALGAVRDLLLAEGLRAEDINTIQLSVPIAPALRGRGSEGHLYLPLNFGVVAFERRRSAKSCRRTGCDATGWYLSRFPRPRRTKRRASGRCRTL